MDPFGIKTTAMALFFSTILAVRSQQRQTLSKTGAIAGFVIGFCLLITGLRGMVLVFFYQLGSWATKYKKRVKQSLDSSASMHSVRGARQVLAVSLVATLLSLYHAVLFGKERSLHLQYFPKLTNVSCSILAHHATSLADTWASELGMVFNHPSTFPVLITHPWRSVPPGTNGGVTLVGVLLSALGGFVVAACTIGMDMISLIPIIQPARILLFGSLCGLIGSLIDSLLGATVQVTFFDVKKKQVSSPSSSPIFSSNSHYLQHVCGMDILTNEQVNLLSTIITTILGGWVLAPLILE